jgi:Zinc carboxypeptidase
MRYSIVLLALLQLLLLPAAAAPLDTGSDKPEPGSIEEIAKATTESRFLSPWVSYLPQSDTVPSPRQYWHRIPGAPGELVNTKQAFGYLRALAQASPRVKLIPIGRSEEGRDILMVAIADETAIQHLDQLKTISAKLADPRLTDAAALPQLLHDGRPFYYLNVGPHSDETGETEAMLELAYRLAVSEQPMIQRIRANTVVLINPISNPDGRDKQVEWFYRYLKGKTDRNTLPRQASPYWSKYAFVDINRDGHQLTHETTKAIHRMFYDWHPVVVHDLHEEVPILMTWNGTGPYNPNIDPITYTEFLALSFHEVEALTGMGMPGVSTWNFGEGFTHVYSESVAMNHNAIGRGYETMGNSSAETMQRTVDPEYTTRQWYRVMPAPSTPFLWSARDNVNYNETAVLAALDQVATHARDYLANFAQKSANSYHAGLAHPPYAFLIDPNQGDPKRVRDLVSRLQSLQIEVQRAVKPFTLKEGSYPQGTYVVRLDQPYRNYAVDLLTPQAYPKDGGEPYDDISWSLPVHYHLSVVASEDPAIAQVALQSVESAQDNLGGVRGNGTIFVLRDSGQESLLEARFKLAKQRVSIAEQAFTLDGIEYPPGSWIIESDGQQRESLARLGAALGLTFSATQVKPQVKQHDAPVPRIGVWVPWADTDSIGWVRYSLDQRGIPYTYVRDEDIRLGQLNSKFDLILYGNVDLELAEQIHGIPAKWSPMPYKKTAQTPSHGIPAASDDITGGIGWEGLAQLQRFIDHGGLFVTLGSGSILALESGLVRGVRRDSGGVPRSSVGGGAAAAAASQDATTRTPGAHVRVRFVQPNHPIAYGYSPHTYVFRQNYPLYETPRYWLRAAYCVSCLDGPFDNRGVVLQWGDDTAPFLVSGQVWGESNLIGRPAIFDLPSGQGHVVVFNFNPLHRDLNRGDQRLLWNTLINWKTIVSAKYP